MDNFSENSDDLGVKINVRHRGTAHEASGMKILSGTELESICVIFNARDCGNILLRTLDIE